MKSVFAAAAVAALSASSASAADLAPHLVTKAPPVAAVYDWTGFYVGVHGGYGWSRGETSAEFPGLGALPAHPDRNPAGGFGGGQIGANFQFAPNWVIGIQGDLSAFSAKDDGAYSGTWISFGIPLSGTYSTQIDRLSSVTGRLGYAFNNVLFYGKGGAAWIRNRFHDTGVADIGGGGGIFIVNDYSGSATRQGWTVGGGVEYGITRNWTVSFEYDYYDFGNSTETLTGATALFIGAPGVPTGSQPEPLQFKQTLSVAKASLNYRF